MTIEIQRGKIITVDRGTNRLYTGNGLLKGLGVIWRHWLASFGKNDSYDKIRGTFTVEYPEERRTLPEAYRNMPILLYDDATGHELCTSCFQCQRICPPQVIHMTQERDPATGKAVPAVAAFVIEYDACMSCGFCAEVCPFDAIKMDNEYELSTATHPSLTVEKEALNRPVSYYERIAPTLWAEVKDSAAKKLQGNIRRRSGVMGIAPNVVDAVRRTSATSVADTGGGQQPQEVRPADTALAAAPMGDAAPADDKAARLAAIKAANAAKRAADAADTPAAPTPAPAATPADEKAVRLAAIKAANAAKRAAANDGEAQQPREVQPANAAMAAAPLPEPEASATAAPHDAPPAPADDKAARLAAIRAANAAKKAAAQSGGDDA